MVLPRKRLLDTHLPKPDGNRPGVFMTNWSAYKKYPASYLSQYKITYFSGIGLFCTTPGERLLKRSVQHAIHAGMTRLGVDLYLDLMMGGNLD